ncbi:MAG: hypothetical protein ACT4OK_08035 [Gemmobacter sp.]
MEKTLDIVCSLALILFWTPASAQEGFVGVNELTSEAAQKVYGITLPASMWCWEEVDGSNTPIRCNIFPDGLHMRVGSLERNVLDWSQIAANANTDGRWVNGSPDAQITWGLLPSSYFGEQQGARFSICARGFAQVEKGETVEPHVAKCFGASLTPGSPILEMWFYQRRWVATGVLASEPPTVGEFEASVGYFSRQVQLF